MGALGEALGVPRAALGAPRGDLGAPRGLLGGPWGLLGSPGGPHRKNYKKENSGLIEFLRNCVTHIAVNVISPYVF